MSKFGPQTENETALQGFNYRYDLTHTDITQASASTAQTFTIFLPARAGDKIKHVSLLLEESFQNTADAAYNDTQIEVGDSGDLDMFVVAIQVNANGTLGTFPAEDTGDALPYTVPATPLAIQLTVLSQSGKTLNTLNKGRLAVLFSIFYQRPSMLLPGAGNLS